MEKNLKIKNNIVMGRNYKAFSKLNLAIKEKKEGVILAKDTEYDGKKIKSYAVYNSYNDILPALSSNKIYHLYEVMTENTNCNYYQDIDIQDKEGRENNKQRLDYIITTTKEYLLKYISSQNIITGDGDIKIDTVQMKSPSTEKKDSYHIIYRITKNGSNLVFNDSKACKNFYEFMTKNNNITLIGCDISVYGKSQCFRILNSSKIDYPLNKLQLITPLDNLLLSLCCYIEKTENDIILKDIAIDKKTKKVKPIELQENPEDLSDDDKLIWNLLDCLNGDRTYDEWNKLGIALYCIYQGDKKGLDMFKRFGKEKCPQKYIEEEHNKYWENYGNLSSLNYRIGTLYYWAKNENKQKFFELFRNDHLGYISSCSELIAKGFKRKFQHLFLKNNENWFFFNEKTGIWKTIKKPYYELHNKISEMANDISKSIISEKLQSRKEALETLVNKMRTLQFRNTIIEELNIWMYVDNKELNNNKFILPFSNGVIDLHNGVFRKGYFEEFITLTTGYDYKKVSTSLAKEYFRSIHPEDDQYEYNLKLFAGCLDGERVGEHFNIKFNPHGSNGKSVLCNLLYSVLGKDFCIISKSVLLTSSDEGAESASPFLNKLKDKRLILFSEVSKNKKFNTEFIRKITGGDVIESRLLFSNEIDVFRIEGTIICVCNTPAKPDEINGAVSRRFRLDKSSVRFVNNPTKPNERPIRNYDENELKYSIINLLIEYYPIYHQNRYLEMTPQMKRETDRYFSNSNYIDQFCQDNIEYSEGDFFTRNNLKALYKDSDNKIEYALHKINFNDFCHDIEVFLDCDFINRKRINGVDYRGVMMNYKLIEEEMNNEPLIESITELD